MSMLHKYKQLLIGLLLLVCILSNSAAYAKFNLYKGNDNLEFSGVITTLYNYRFDEDKPEKNVFRLKDAQIQLKGRVLNDFTFELQVDFASYLQDSGALSQEPLIMDAKVGTDLFFLDIGVGYQKIPFSFHSLSTSHESVFLQRPDLISDFISRRALGILLERSFFDQKLNAFLGVFNNFNGLNKDAADRYASKTPELAARIDIAFPSRFRYEAVDRKITPFPLAALGLSFRYAEYAGDFTDNNDPFDDDYYPVTIDGKRLLIEGDLGVKFMGIAFSLEYIYALYYPDSVADSAFIPAAWKSTTDYLASYGLIAEVNYYAKTLNAVFAVRYSSVNPNDLVVGNSRATIHYGFNYLLNGFNARIKFQYAQRLAQSEGTEQWKEDELRLGLQILFR